MSDIDCGSRPELVGYHLENDWNRFNSCVSWCSKHLPTFFVSTTFDDKYERAVVWWVTSLGDVVVGSNPTCPNLGAVAQAGRARITPPTPFVRSFNIDSLGWAGANVGYPMLMGRMQGSIPCRHRHIWCRSSVVERQKYPLAHFVHPSLFGSESEDNWWILDYMENCCPVAQLVECSTVNREVCRFEADRGSQ